ncbi:hypothetical protein N9D94_07430 [Gammaproteobacteria bacterium]|jgi:hypothetical protein|nr:hypothetical protein [Gammaproteobacteria bacterium]
MGFPFEIITMLGSTLLSGLLSLWSQRMKAKQEEQKMLIARTEVQNAAISDARNYDNKGFQFTRRIIALTAIFSIVLLPKLVPLFYPEILVTVGYTNWKPGFLFFTDGQEIFEWVSFNGLVITQLDTNLVSAIIGMYFGGSLVKK